VIRPGYTFGGPALEGGSIYSDEKLPNLVRAGRDGEPVTATRGEGTQFIWVGDLAQVYRAVLDSPHTRRLYTAVSRNFTSWAEIAVMAGEHAGTPARINYREPGSDQVQVRHDVSALAEDFGLGFDSTARLREHVGWLAGWI
jgi:UDP-glucose 4-epimerase